MRTAFSLIAMKDSEFKKKPLRVLGSFIILGLFFYYGIRYEEKRFLISFGTAGAILVPFLLYRYLVPFMSKLAGPASVEKSKEWTDDLLGSLAELMADPSDVNIEALSDAIKRSGLKKQSIRDIFEGPMTTIYAVEWRAASFAFEDIQELKPEHLRNSLIKNYRSSVIVRKTPLWLFYKFLMPSSVRSAFKKSLYEAYLPEAEFHSLYQ